MNEGCESCLINGLPCSSANVIIEPLNTMPYGCYFNTDGTITIPASTMPFESEIYYNLRSVQNPTSVFGPYRVNFGISPKVITANPIIYINDASSGSPDYSQIGNTNILDTPLISYISTTTTGDCNSYNPASIGFSNISNTVSITDLTPMSIPYIIDTGTGAILFRPPYSSSNLPAPPTLPERAYQLTYEMCINNTGATTFCEIGTVTVYYVYANRMANPNNIVKVYPNPSIDGIYTLTFEEKFATGQVKVYDLMGLMIHQEEITSSNETRLYLNSLPKGTYIVKTTINNTTYTNKLVKQ